MGDYLEDMLVDLQTEQRRLREETKAALDNLPDRRGSRFVGQGAQASLAEHVASGGVVETYGRKHISEGSKSLAAYDHGSTSLVRDLKALAAGTTSSGGALTFPTLAADLTPLLRARTAVLALGARVLPVATELDVAGLSTGATAYWVGENAAIPTSEETFTFSAILRPRGLAALIPVSNRLLRDAQVSPSLDEALKSDLSTVLSLRADLAFLRGTGTGAEPTGLRNYTGLTPAPDLGVNGRAVTYDDLIDMVAALRNINAPFESPGWIFNARLIQSLQKVKTSTGQYLTDASLMTFDKTGGGGTLMGFPFRTTSQIPVNITRGTSTDTSEIYFSSDWNEYWVGQEDNLMIELSTEGSYTPDGGTTWISAFQNQQTLFRATIFLDGAPRRAQLFSCMVGVRP